MPLSESEIKARIADLENQVGWYQDIHLGNGLRTKSRVFWGEDPDHPRARWQEIAPGVPADLSGMSVLDIGCNAGFIAFEAKARGADYVCGVDLKPGYIEQAKFCAEAKGVDVDFRVLDVYELEKLGRQFDFVFFVGILYHCRHLTVAIDQVSSVAKDRVIVESAIDPSNTPTPYVRFVRSSQFEERGRKLPGHWHPTMSGMEALFAEAGFPHIHRLFKIGGRGGVLAARNPCPTPVVSLEPDASHPGPTPHEPQTRPSDVPPATPGGAKTSDPSHLSPARPFSFSLRHSLREQLKKRIRWL
ncbi:MAG: methyltransferase domain-containing protein [Deltaproteobacteria bacterium]|nr:methyltransferase domain-containing protein [Deltaproteobacteria bacterium]